MKNKHFLWVYYLVFKKFIECAQQQTEPTQCVMTKLLLSQLAYMLRFSKLHRKVLRNTSFSMQQCVNMSVNENKTACEYKYLGGEAATNDKTIADLHV